MIYTDKVLKVLSIGNSYAEDAFEYVPFLWKNFVPDTELTFGIYHIGGCTLETHYINSQTDAPLYGYHKYVPGSNVWRHTYEEKLSDGITDEDWDIIILQQQSWNSQNYETYQPFLDGLIEYIFKNVRKPVRLLWHLTPSYGTEPDNGLQMFENTACAAKKVIENTPIEYVIPNGTALQNARGTRLKEIGDERNLSCEKHTQEGLGCQIEAYTSILTFLHLLGKDYRSVIGDKTVINSDWTEPKDIPYPNGEPVGSCVDNLLLAQKCCLMAVKNPFSVTEIN